MIRTALEFIKKEMDSYMAERENDLAKYMPCKIDGFKLILSLSENKLKSL